MSDVLYEGTAWNVEEALKTNEKQFVEQGMKDGAYKQFQDKDRLTLLKEAYRQIKLKEAGL